MTMPRCGCGSHKSPTGRTSTGYAQNFQKNLLQEEIKDLLLTY